MNIYEDCVPCHICGHPFLPFYDEKICEECQEFDEIRNPEAGTNKCKTNRGKNKMDEDKN